MRLVNYFPDGGSRDVLRLGSVIDTGILDIPAAWAWYSREVRRLPGAPPPSIPELLTASDAVWEALREISGWFSGERIIPENEGAGGSVKSIQSLKFAAPVPKPPTVRDFYAFEQHVRTARKLRDQPVPEEWYQIPVFYYSNPGVIFGPGDDVPCPAYTRELDYELELACVIRRQGRDLAPDQALEQIAGYTIMNDWSARDVQCQETRVGLGPAKGKDFATSFGPYLVTPDELDGRVAGRKGVFDLEMTARVNGVERSKGNAREMYYSFGDMLARASQAVTLQPGDLIGSGTVGGGCLLELTLGKGPWLEPGDRVELEIECLGKLENRVTLPGAPG
jgi:fumarylacetoacetate (FAA) hydrolase